MPITVIPQTPSIMYPIHLSNSGNRPKTHIARFVEVRDNIWIDLGLCREVGVYKGFSGFLIYFELSNRIYYHQRVFETQEEARKYLKDNFLSQKNN